jgi:hypothetical protein
MSTQWPEIRNSGDLRCYGSTTRSNLAGRGQFGISHQRHEHSRFRQVESPIVMACYRMSGGNIEAKVAAQLFDVVK